MRNRLTGTAEALDDERIKNQIYASLGPSVTTTCQQNLPEDTPFQNIMDAIARDERMHTLENHPPTTKEALYTKVGTTTPEHEQWCTSYLRNTHTTECWTKKRRHDSNASSGRESTKTISLNPAVRCFHRGEQGHVIRDCFIRNKGLQARKKMRNKRPKHKNEVTNIATGTRPAGFGF